MNETAMIGLSSIAEAIASATKPTDFGEFSTD